MMKRDSFLYRRLFIATCFILFVTKLAYAKVPISYRDAAMLSSAERQILDVKARQGDESAAFRLATYYSSIAKDLKRREYYLVLATKNGSFESIEALADFYAMPGGIFNLDKAVAFRKTLKRKFPYRTNNTSWAEACAYDYHWRTPGGNPGKERLFLNLAAKWRAQAR